MTLKTIKITKNLYDLLQTIKRKNETYTELITRILIYYMSTEDYKEDIKKNHLF